MKRFLFTLTSLFLLAACGQSQPVKHLVQQVERAVGQTLMQEGKTEEAKKEMAKWKELKGEN